MGLRAGDRPASTPVVADAPASPAPAPKPKPKAEAPAPVVEKQQLGVKVSKDLKDRARAAFRHARFHEQVPTFGEFVENALEAEIQRLEGLYNGGEKFEPDSENLPRGRTI
ncbi:hypothetical protein [Leucobacter sp. MMO-4]